MEGVRDCERRFVADSVGPTADICPGIVLTLRGPDMGMADCFCGGTVLRLLDVQTVCPACPANTDTKPRPVSVGAAPCLVRVLLATYLLLCAGPTRARPALATPVARCVCVLESRGSTPLCCLWVRLCGVPSGKATAGWPASDIVNSVCRVTA